MSFLNLLPSFQDNGSDILDAFLSSEQTKNVNVSIDDQKIKPHYDHGLSSNEVYNAPNDFSSVGSNRNDAAAGYLPSLAPVYCTNQENSDVDFLDLLLPTHSAEQSTNTSLECYFSASSSNSASEFFDDTNRLTQTYNLDYLDKTQKCSTIKNMCNTTIPISNASGLSNCNKALNSESESIFPCYFQSTDQLISSDLGKWTTPSNNADQLSNLNAYSKTTSSSSYYASSLERGTSTPSLSYANSLLSCKNSFPKTLATNKCYHLNSLHLDKNFKPSPSNSFQFPLACNNDSMHEALPCNFTHTSVNSTDNDVQLSLKDLPLFYSKAAIVNQGLVSSKPGNASASFSDISEFDNLLDNVFQNNNLDEPTEFHHTSLDKDVNEQSNIYKSSRKNVGFNSSSGNFCTLEKEVDTQYSSGETENSLSISSPVYDVCPSCKKFLMLTNFKSSSLMLCQKCSEDLESSLTSSSCSNNKKLETINNDLHHSTNSVDCHKIQQSPLKNPSSVTCTKPTPAHLIAINTNANGTANSSAPSMYIVVEGKAIPLQLAQIPAPILFSEQSGTSVLDVGMITNTSINNSSNPATKVTKAKGQILNSSNNLIKIAPLPSNILSSQSNSCMMLAGITPGPSVSKNTSSNKNCKVDDDSLRIHSCTHPGCNKRYTKSSHLKTHMR